MSSAAPGQPLPPPAPDDPHWPLTDFTPPLVRRLQPDEFEDNDELDAPGWINSPSSEARTDYREDIGERALSEGERDARDTAQERANRQARDRAISAIKVFVGIFLPGMLLLFGIGLFMKSLSSSGSEGDAAPPSANSSPIAAQAPAAPAAVADPLLDADALAISFVGHLAADDFGSAALMTKKQHTADRLKELFGNAGRPLQPIVVDTDPAGRERYTVRMAIIAGAVAQDGAEPQSVWCVDLDVVPLDGLVDVSSEPLDVTANAVGSTGVELTVAANQACAAAHLTALQN